MYNFQKIRLYIDNATEFEQFNLFELDEETFQKLYLFFSKDSIFKNITLKLKEESLLHEENVSAKLYADYSKFKHDIYNSLVKNNPQHDKLTLFKKSQKLLDRFLFVLFAEDSGLVPPNAISKILEQWKTFRELDEPVSLYSRFVKLFHHLDTGHKYKTYELPAYNGGLFKTDELLDQLIIDDIAILDNVLKLSNYDYNTEVDVNILGHIFEHSISEIEEITSKLEGNEIDRQKTRRKKEGIFYTPKYITKYIVDNTLGTLCEEKKIDLEITEIDSEILENPRTSRHTLTRKAKNLFNHISEYRVFLLNLKILDPACGSGAFLNQALEFLISEHEKIDEIQDKITGDKLGLFNIRKSILENNLFGVDINEESVEIAKLSLWLRTAERGRKLTFLSNNIKCGNSLIDDPEIAGDKAFNWQKEFPDIFREKEKKAWHITCATYNSRYSQRMFDNHVKVGEPIWLSEKEEQIVTEKIAEIVDEDELNILAYNICGDHMHLLLVCEEEELPKIVQKIKSMSARACNIAMGRTIPASASATEHTYFSKEEGYATGATREQSPLSDSTPLSDSITSPKDAKKEKNRGTTQAHLWTQKFGCNKITSEQQLNNTVEYIRNNRHKHELPDFNNEACFIVEKMTCTPDHAFRSEYKGGFDVVIGNPPYGAYLDDETKKFISRQYETFQGNFEIYFFFIELANKLLKDKGKLSYITPDTWISIPQAQRLREHVLDLYGLNTIVTYKYSVFADASVNSIVFILTKGIENTHCEIFHVESKNLDVFYKVESSKKSDVSKWEKSNYKQFQIWQDDNDISIIEKIEKNSEMGEVFLDVCQGIVPYSTENLTKYEVKQRIYHNAEKIGDDYGLWVQGRAIRRYGLQIANKEFLKYGVWLHRPRKPKYFHGKRILVQEITGGNPPRISATIYDRELYHDPGIISCLNNGNLSTEYLVGIINSKMLSWYNLKTSPKGKRTAFPKVLIGDIRRFPIKIPTNLQEQAIIKNVNIIMQYTDELQDMELKFAALLKNKLDIKKLNNKFQNWHELDVKEFLKDLKKAKVQLSLSEEAEWMQYFNEQKQKALELKAEIDKTDKEINQMVYKLYGLTEEEIKIVEESIQIQI